MLHEIQYFDDGDVACYNGYSFRRDKRSGYYLSGRPINGKRQRLHIYVWETEHGQKVPAKHDIHHVDMDKNNNYIGNLMLVTKQQHRFFHQLMMTQEQRDAVVENMVKNVSPKAREWHRSKEGHEWHKKHGCEVFQNLKPVKYICTNCGKEFETVNHYNEKSNKFCSNNCKSAYRRKMGYDDVVRKCERCGAEYVTNKYSKRKYCESCWRKTDWRGGCLQHGSTGQS